MRPVTVLSSSSTKSSNGTLDEPANLNNSEDTIMKLIKAVVRPEKLSDVLEALYQADVKGLTVSRVQGHGGEIESVETYRGTSVKMGLTDKVMLDIGVSDSFVDATVQAVINAAQTGEVGDGKIFILPVEAVHRIRTAEQDQAAVTPVVS